MTGRREHGVHVARMEAANDRPREPRESGDVACVWRR
jgi:hypothetical protein